MGILRGVGVLRSSSFMDSISKQVYVEDQYPGVTLGVINHPVG